MARLISCDTVNGILFEVLEPRGKVRHCHVHCHADTTVPVTSYPLILAPSSHTACLAANRRGVRSCAVPTPPATSHPMHRSHTAAHTLHASQPTGEIVTPSQLAACCGLSTWGCWACIKIGDLSLSAWITRVTGLSAGNGVCDDGVDRLKLLSRGVQELLQAAASKECSEEQQLQSVRLHQRALCSVPTHDAWRTTPSHTHHPPLTHPPPAPCDACRSLLAWPKKRQRTPEMRSG